LLSQLNKVGGCGFRKPQNGVYACQIRSDQPERTSMSIRKFFHKILFASQFQSVIFISLIIGIKNILPLQKNS